jgi:peptidoglycan/xylan/chitin deacetylase (PgdA/CDA1 family)
MSLVILTYHSLEGCGASDDVVPEEERLYLVRQRMFETQMCVLAQQGMRSLTMNEVISATDQGAPLPARAICITFDDGKASDYNIAFPVLKRLGLTGTFFVVTQRVGQPGYVTWAQLKEMAVHGMSIQSHSLTHPFLSQCHPTQVSDEFARSKAVIEDKLERPVTCFALPGGDWNSVHRAIAETCGYRAVCTSDPGVNADLDLWRLERFAVCRGDSINRFTSLVTLRSWTVRALLARTACLRAARRSLGITRYNAIRQRLLRLVG